MWRGATCVHIWPFDDSRNRQIKDMGNRGYIFRGTVMVALLCCATAAFARLPHKRMGLQFYSIRDTLGTSAQYQKNHDAIFRQLKEWGFTFVEAGDGSGYGLTPEEFRSDLKRYGLESIGGHLVRVLTDEELASGDFTAALDWWQQRIDTHRRAGCRYLIMSWAPVPKNIKDADVWCQYLNAIGQLCHKGGLGFGYHTHFQEYQKVDDHVWVDYMMRHVKPENMFWQMDVYWCVYAQESPVYWFRRFPGRFHVLHIKDKHEIGYSGMLGFDAIFRNADVCGLQEIILEIENTDGTISSMEAVRRSAEYIRRADFVKKSYGGYNYIK